MNQSASNPAVIFCIGGFAVVTLGGCAGLRSHEAQAWDEVPGRITECRTKTLHMRTLSDSRLARYEKKIRYEYDYQGQTLEGSRVGFDVMISTVRCTGFDLAGRTAGLESG